jgi:GNAT superfamily N-acetyltransferase
MDGGESIGCAALGRKDAQTGELKRLYVRGAAQGQGLGRRLVLAVIEHARELGMRRLVLDTIERKMGTAVRLYESLGFRATGRRQAGGYELLDMELDLI